MSTTIKSLSTTYIVVRFGVIEKTAQLFMHVVTEAIKSIVNQPIKGTIHVDEFVIDGNQKGKVGRSYDSK